MGCEIVASTMPRSPRDGIDSAARAARAGAHRVELRLDHWPASTSLEAMLAEIGLPVLVTCRMPRDGGGFSGTLDERRALLTRALDAGADGVDLEEWESWTPEPRPTLVVRSLHDQAGVPNDLPALRDRLGRDGSVAKIVASPADLADAAPLLSLLADTDQRGSPTVAFGLGAAAWPTRLLGCVLGAPLLYASVEPGAETAPGQVPVDTLVELYRANELGRDTAVLGVLGDPALPSPGPWLHNRAQHALGVDAVYLPLETARPDAVLAMLAPFRRQGFSVTAPHKQTVVPLCAELDPVAAKCGAVNTLTFGARGRMNGHNTDVAGVVRALQNADVAVGDGRCAAVLGTGGAARAAAVGLDELGFAVHVLGRRLDGIDGWARDRGCALGTLERAELDRLRPRVVVQSTPVGGLTDPDARLVPDWSPEPDTAVLDMITRPPTTRLLRDVAAAGAQPIPGVEMFLSQAAVQLALWWDQHFDVDQLRTFLPDAS